MLDANKWYSHDLLGRSAAKGAFVVWVHNMKNITYNPTFVPQGSLADEMYDGKNRFESVGLHP